MFSSPRPNIPPHTSSTRSLQADEEYLLSAYETHARVCAYCENPLRSARLCCCGTILARAVVRYLYRRSGGYYSRFGHAGGETDRVHLPSSTCSVHRLLAAVEQGLLPDMASEAGGVARSADRRSVEIIERRPHNPESTHRAIRCPFLRRRVSSISTRLPRPYCFMPLGVEIGGRRKSRKAKIEVELTFYAKE